MKKVYYNKMWLLILSCTIELLFIAIMVLTSLFIPKNLLFINVMFLIFCVICNFILVYLLFSKNNPIYLTKEGVFIEEKVIAWAEIESLKLKKTWLRTSFIFKCKSNFSFTIKSKLFRPKELSNNILRFSDNIELNKMVNTYFNLRK